MVKANFSVQLWPKLNYTLATVEYKVAIVEYILYLGHSNCYSVTQIFAYSNLVMEQAQQSLS